MRRQWPHSELGGGRQPILPTKNRHERPIFWVASNFLARPPDERYRAIGPASNANGRSATPQYHEMGHPPQSRGGGRRTQRQDHSGGRPAPLSTLGGGVPLVAACVRDAWPCWFACHARSAIPWVASTERPKITTLIPSVFGRPPRVEIYN
jgi:hypothetical protein